MEIEGGTKNVLKNVILQEPKIISVRLSNLMHGTPR